MSSDDDYDAEQQASDYQDKRAMDAFESGRHMEQEQNERRRKEETARIWRNVGIAGLIVLAMTVTQFPWGSPYEGEPLSLALMMGVLLQLVLFFIGIGFGGLLLYRIGKRLIAEVQSRNRTSSK